jgi:hypothetical protein
MDFFAMKNQDVEKGEYWSLMGVSSGDDLEPVRRLARRWLQSGADALRDGRQVAELRLSPLHAPPPRIP